MFKLIKPSDQSSHKDLIRPILEVVRDNPSLSCSFKDTEKATFIVFQDEMERNYGGAILLRKKVSSLQKKIERKVRNFASKDGEIWVSTLCLCIEHQNLSASSEFFYETFYRSFYKQLIEFGTKEQIKFISMILEPGEHLCTEVFGMWPYLFDANPYEALSGLFHGVLSLKTSLARPNINDLFARVSARNHEKRAAVASPLVIIPQASENPPYQKCG